MGSNLLSFGGIDKFFSISSFSDPGALPTLLALAKNCRTRETFIYAACSPGTGNDLTRFGIFETLNARNGES
jgi:hypothetical protein